MKGLKEHPALAIPRSVVDYLSPPQRPPTVARWEIKGNFRYTDFQQCVRPFTLLLSTWMGPELNAALTLAKLLSHTTKALDPTVLYWLENKGKWSQYVGNRVAKIQDLGSFVWHYVPTAQNPSVTRLTLLRTVFVKVTRHRFVM